MQLGADIAIGIGFWADYMLCPGTLIAVLDYAYNQIDRIIKVYDTDTSNMQVGADIELGAWVLA